QEQQQTADQLTDSGAVGAGGGLVERERVKRPDGRGDERGSLIAGGRQVQQAQGAQQGLEGGALGLLLLAGDEQASGQAQQRAAGGRGQPGPEAGGGGQQAAAGRPGG